MGGIRCGRAGRRQRKAAGTGGAVPWHWPRCVAPRACGWPLHVAPPDDAPPVKTVPGSRDPSRVPVALRRSGLADKIPKWVNRAANTGNKVIPNIMSNKLMDRLDPPAKLPGQPPVFVSYTGPPPASLSCSAIDPQVLRCGGPRAERVA